MKKHSETVKQWRLNNPNKVKAHIIINNAVRKGLIFKKPCEHCGVEKVEAHHNDYDKPLDVVWLCRSCHGKIHRKERKHYKKQIKSIVKDGKKRSSKSMFLTHETLIKELRGKGLSYNSIAKQLNISKSQAFKVCNNPNYK